MDKRQARIEALEIASSLCSGCDCMMWDLNDPLPENDKNKIIRALEKLATQLHCRAKTLKDKKNKS